jgi:uncharacterized membrane protein
VQTRTVPKIKPAEHRAAITKYIQPNVMFWFRYAALATVVFGLLLALMNGYLLQALKFQWGTVAIGIGMWLALIMAFIVWFIVWSNDKKVLGIVEATRRRTASPKWRGASTPCSRSPCSIAWWRRRTWEGSASED